MSSDAKDNLEENQGANPSNSNISGSSQDAPLPPNVEEVGPEETEGSEAAEGVTMLDVIQDETELEEDARAVLGGADDRNCTYGNNYLKRQALYACVTCSMPNAPDFTPAGVCLACSYACHNDHTLVELYTKRNFRCDCGNSKFPKSNQCKLIQDKDMWNERNQYNQNYRGLYCTCHRPYPDEEDPVPDAMIQCVICEDWLHRRHLNVEGNQPPCDTAFSELICHLCVEKHHEAFLFAYKGFSVLSISKNETVDALDENVEISENQENSTSKSIENDNNEVCKVPTSPRAISPDLKGEKEKQFDVGKCHIKKENLQHLKASKPGSLFMLQGWREQLCKCGDCKTKYHNLSLEYLLDPEDTVHYYENQAETNKSSQYEDGMNALSKMDRTKQVEAIHGYNDMKSNLMEYLKKFAENKKVVREEDIQEFFQKMAGNKKMRSNIPDSCK